ncbi:MAG: DNA polymerase subunit beta [ANME-2 cluster archaeon]|nr:DNA polymerase subunit beta [ANME-2 cluster archaeon]MDF1532450.1 DNA polymerase subunit beta [ANME-2 cluster archaeon]
MDRFDHPGVRLRDFIITRDGWVFSSADYYHPEGVRGVLRYVPDPEGERTDGTRNYRKYDFDEAYRYMDIHKPEWVQDVHVVPWDQVERVLSPSERLGEIWHSDPRIEEITATLLEGGIPMESMGITGSFLPGLQNGDSDIDFMVYGPLWFKARDIIARAKDNPGSNIQHLDERMWERIYHKRIPEISFEEFKLHEVRKGNRGMVGDTYFDLLFVRDWDQVTAPLGRGTDLGHETIEAIVTEAQLAFDSPSIYKVDHPEMEYVLSYTHTYAGQALEGETIEARGMVEDVEGHRRLVVGTSREPKGEWIRSLSLLGSDAQEIVSIINADGEH